MKEFCTSNRWLFQATLAFMLLLIVTACENDEPEPVVPVTFAANAGPDMNVVTAQAVPLGTAHSPHPEVTYSWKIISKPDNSQAALTDADKLVALFLADVPGKYDLELKAANGSSAKYDLLTITAFSVKQLTGIYPTKFVADGIVRRLVSFKNQLYAIGDFTKLDGVTANHFASFDGNNWSPLNEISQQFPESIYFQYFSEVVEFQDELFFSGIFSRDDSESQYIASWDGNQWKSLEIRTKSPGEEYYNRSGAMAVFDDQLYIGGHFSDPWEAYTLVRWDGEKLTGVETEIDAITDLIVYNSRLMVSGFTGNTVASPYLASFDGSSWNKVEITDQLQPGFNSISMLFGPMAVFQNKLYLTLEGWDQPFGWGYTASELVVWDGEKVIDYGKPFSFYGGNLIYNLQTIGDQVFIAGSFNKVVGSSSKGLVTWDGQDWGVIHEDGYSVNYMYSFFQDKIYTTGVSFNDADPSYGIALWRQ